MQRRAAGHFIFSATATIDLEHFKNRFSLLATHFKEDSLTAHKYFVCCAIIE